jgi:hypothetical protein
MISLAGLQIRVALTLIQLMAPVPNHRIQPIWRPIRPNILAIYDQISLYPFVQ